MHYDKFKFSQQSPATLDPLMVIFKMCGYMLLLLVLCSLFNGYILLLLRCTNGDTPKLHGLFCIFVQVKGTKGIFYSSNILEHCNLIGTILGIKTNIIVHAKVKKNLYMTNLIIIILSYYHNNHLKVYSTIRKFKSLQIS